MADSSDVTGTGEAVEAGTREMWGSRWGFVLAAVGSAVGLGNMWRFPYVTSEGGGAAFVALYIVFVLLLGIPLMLSELSVGRRTHLSPIAAVKKIGGASWAPLGMLFVLTGILILSFYSVIAGWTVRYSLEAVFAGFPAEPGAHFESIAAGWDALGFHLLFMAITIGIIIVGVQKGIERAVFVLMPILFVILAGLALWAVTLEGAGGGYAFYLQPDLGDLLQRDIIVGAAGQAFFSLSLGMGAILTYASYLSRRENLNREAVTISFSDFGIAFLAGLVVFPIIYALGFIDEVGESAVGALFIALPGAFEEMGGFAGRATGTLFFVALALGALTSAISLLEVVTASIMDEYGVDRKRAAIGMGTLIAVLGVGSAYSTDLLGLVDEITANFLIILGALFTVILVGWVMTGAGDELRTGARGPFAALVPFVLWLVRYVIPLVILIVFIFSVPEAWGALTGFFGGGE